MNEPILILYSDFLKFSERLFWFQDPIQNNTFSWHVSSVPLSCNSFSCVMNQSQRHQNELMFKIDIEDRHRIGMYKNIYKYVYKCGLVYIHTFPGSVSRKGLETVTHRSNKHI